MNSDGSLTKIADGSAEVQEYDADEDTDYYEDPSDFSDSSPSSGGSSSGSSSSASSTTEGGSSDVESTVE